MKILLIALIPGMLVIASCHNRISNENDRGNIVSIASKEFYLKPENLQAQNVIRITNGHINAIFVDNTSFGDDHKAGYNGIASLTHSAQDSSIFVPYYAGFNLEHIFGGDSLIELFEPRKHPMELYKISDLEVLLYQSPTPMSSVESQTLFKLVNPHYIDITFRFVIHDPKFFKHGYAGLFWASYIHAPADKNINFLGRENDSDSITWISAYSSKHGYESTHLWKNGADSIFFAANFNATLASHLSNYKYDQAYYYGRFHNMVLAYLFYPDHRIRFSQSPTGGGEQNPAWDFQYIVTDFKVGQEYVFHARMMYKEFIGAEDVKKEYENWKSTFKSK